jgi:hypothetical protein
MKKPKKVQSPELCSDYLTPGKIYNVVGFWRRGSGVYGYRFTIKDDNGNILYCLQEKCYHIKYNNWIIIEIENESN